MKGKILIAEDNVELNDIMRNYLIRDGYEVYQAYNGDQAIKMAKAFNVDLIILDIMMPVKDGYVVVNTLRDMGINIPVIVTSAKVSEDDKEKMFSLGADDYMTKPFSFKEAVMRVNAQLRRSQQFNKTTSSVEEIRDLGNLTIMPERFEVKANGVVLQLSNKEFKLLDVLTREAGRTFSKSQLLDKVWGIEDYVDENTVAVTIARLREKLEKVNVNNVKTVWGFGYKWQG